MSNQLSNKIPILFFILLTSTQTSSALQISEIMYDPVFDYNYNEWVEIYNNESFDIDLVNTRLCDDVLLPGFINHSDGKLYLNDTSILPAHSFAVITDGNSKLGPSGTDAYSNYTILGYAFHVNSSSLCNNGLLNNGEEINMSQDGSLLENMTYMPYSKSTVNRSLSRKETENGIVFLESTPTPGYANQFIIEDAQNTTNKTSSSDAITRECDWKMEIILEKDIFDESDKFAFKTKSTKISGSKTNISGYARLVNANGDVIKRYDLFENYEATYSKTIAISNSQVSGEMRIEAELKTSCEDTDVDNNIATEYVYVKKDIAVSTKEREQRRTPLFEQGSRLEIDGSDDKAELLFYRGNTSKYAVYITLNSDGEKTRSTIHLKDKYSEYSMSLPFPKCASENVVVLEGLGLHEERTFVKENPCQKQIDPKADNMISPEPAEIEVNKNNSQVKSGSNMLTGNSVLDVSNSDRRSFSQDFDAKQTSVIVLLALSIIMNVLFIWYR